MNEHFRHHVEAIHPLFEALLKSAPFSFSDLPKHLPQAGIYLFTEGDRHFYVGRTNRIRKRLQQHCRPGSPHDGTPFAFRLAREARNALGATYRREGYAPLMQDPAFCEAFAAAKTRLRAMHIRVIEEGSPFRQALLEMYVAPSLETPYNDFCSH